MPVIREEIGANPPVRKRQEIGYARVDLKPGAEPKKQRPIHLACEGLEAMTKIANFWVEKELVGKSMSP